MDKTNLVNGNKLERLKINFRERKDISSFIYSKYYYLCEISNIEKNEIISKENLINYEIINEAIFLQIKENRNDILREFINKNILEQETSQENISVFQTNFNQANVLYGYFDNQIEINLIINIFFCLKENCFVFEFIPFDIFEVFSIKI